MALIESKVLALGTIMPSFSLADPSGERYTLEDIKGAEGTLIVFTCNHCPYALAIWPRLIRLAIQAGEDGIGTVAINPNIHPDYPDDQPEKMAEKMVEWGIPFPYLVDQDQQVARQYGAECTPDIYLLDQENRLVYHGRLDDNWKNESAVTRRELWEAIEAMVNGIPISTRSNPSIGCSIKWRSNA